MDEKQVCHCMLLRPFTSRAPILDVQTNSEEWRPDPEVIFKHDELYARAWESDFGKPIFDNDQNEPSPPNPREATVDSDPTKDKTCSTSGTNRKVFPEVFHPGDGLFDGTDTDHYMQNPNITPLLLRFMPVPTMDHVCTFSGNVEERVRELIRSSYWFSHVPFWIVPCNLQTCSSD